MKRLLQILAVAVITMTTFATSSNAFATGTCAVGYTGPNSDNLCTSTIAYDCTVINTTDVKIANENVQFVASGGAGGTINTVPGAVTTGSSTNSNGTSFNVIVTNGSIANPGNSCTAVATVPATTAPASTSTPTPAGTTTPLVAAPNGMGAASSLPNTSGDQTIAYAAGLAGILGIIAVVSRLAIATYSRLKQ